MLSLTVVAPSAVSSLFSICTFLGMGTYLLRCQLMLSRYLSTPGRVVIRTDEPSPADMEFRNAMLSYLVSNHVGDSCRKRTVQRVTGFLQDLFSVWTGRLCSWS